MEVLVLHDYPELMEQCCELINSEWPRSRTARLRGLEVSCRNLPTCLVLVEKTGNHGSYQVVGHSKISRIPAIPIGGFIESVVIHKALRGKGLGRKLMQDTERYMQSIGLTESYLSTYDQQIFYTKLGYTYCERISIYGSPLGSSLQFQNTEKNNEKLNGNISVISMDIPPPPPLPEFIKKSTNLSSFSGNSLQGKPKKDFMKKILL